MPSFDQITKDNGIKSQNWLFFHQILPVTGFFIIIALIFHSSIYTVQKNENYPDYIFSFNRHSAVGTATTR